MMKVKNNKEHPVPFYNLPEKVQVDLEKDFGTNGVDFLKSLDREELLEVVEPLWHKEL